MCLSFMLSEEKSLENEEPSSPIEISRKFMTVHSYYHISQYAYLHTHISTCLSVCLQASILAHMPEYTKM